MSDAGKLPVGTLYAKCRHVIFEEPVAPFQVVDFKNEYDWCPVCAKKIIDKQNELQMVFKGTFGGDDDNTSNSEQ